MEGTVRNVHVGNIDELISELETQFGDEMELGAQSNDDILSGSRCTNNCTDGVNCHTK